jgi:hypothetical protein
MIRSIQIALLVLFAAPVGCASGEHLAGRMSVLEQEISDLQQANRKIHQRIDELQIQLSVLTKKLSPRTTASDTDLPDLKVVKLKPEPDEPRVSVKKKKRPSDKMIEFDPRSVTERLPVDPQAARLPLWEKEHLASQTADATR